MNSDTIQAVAQVILIFAGAWLAKNHISLTSADITGAIGAVMTVVGIIWKSAHLASLLQPSPNLATTNVTAGKGNGLGANVPLFALLLLPLFFAGCSTPPIVGHVVSQTDFCFGLDVQTTSSPQNTPRIRIGLVRNATIVEPVATNVTLTVPNVANNFGLDNQASTPISLDVSEAFASGDYQTGNPSSTNAITAQPIVPK